MPSNFPTLEDNSFAVTTSLDDCVLNILESVSGTDEVRTNLDIALFDAHILDSFDMMSVIVELSDALHMDISPAEVERETWETPRKIIQYIHRRTRA